MPKAASFVEWLLTRSETPEFMLTPVASRDLGCIGQVFDAQMESMLRAVQSGLLANPNCPSDALDLIGRSRMLPRYDVDTDSTYRSRLYNAWETWGKSGSREQLAEELENWGMASGSVFIVSNKDWGTAEDPTDAPNTLPAWSGEPEASLWASFRIYVKHTGHPFTAGNLFDDGSVFDEGKLFDVGNMTAQQAFDVHELIERHRAAHELALSITFLLDAGTSGFTAPHVFSGASVTLDLVNI